MGTILRKPTSESPASGRQANVEPEKTSTRKKKEKDTEVSQEEKCLRKQERLAKLDRGGLIYQRDRNSERKRKKFKVLVAKIPGITERGVAEGSVQREII